MRGARHPQVKWVAFRSWFDLTDDAISERVQAIQAAFPEADLVYLDFFAPLALRYARMLGPLVKTYVKKQVFKDLTHYRDVTRRGHQSHRLLRPASWVEPAGNEARVSR